MVSRPKLDEIIRASALRNARLRLAGRLVSSLGLRPSSDELGVPLGVPEANDNLVAVCNWVERNHDCPAAKDFESIRAALARSVTKWELDRWD